MPLKILMTDRTLALNWWLGPSKNSMLNGSNIRSSTHHGKVDGFPDVLFRHIHDLLVKNIHYFFAQFCQVYWYICFNDPPLAKSMRMSLGWIQLLLCLRSVCLFGMVTFFQPCLSLCRDLWWPIASRWASLGPSNYVKLFRDDPNLSLERCSQLSDQCGGWVFQRT